MYITKWDEFLRGVEKLYSEKPDQTRYQVKYSHKKGRVILKVTDDFVVSLFFSRALRMHPAHTMRTCVCMCARVLRRGKVLEMENRRNTRYEEGR